MKTITTIPYGLYKNNKKREETVTRITKTLIVTEYGRYSRKDGMNIDITNKTVGGYRLSDDTMQSIQQLNDNTNYIIKERPGHQWERVAKNSSNFICKRCGSIGYIPNSLCNTSDKNIESAYNCDDVLAKRIMSG